MKGISGSSIRKKKIDYYDRLCDSISAAVLVIDPKDYNIMDVNQAASDMIGLPKEKILGNKCKDYFCPDEKCPFLNPGKKYYDREKKIRKKDGRKIPILKTARLIEYQGKRLLVETVRDISQVKQKEEEYSKIVKITHDGFWMIDSKGRKITDVNDSYCKMSGYTREELIGMHINELDIIETERVTKERLKMIEKEGYTKFETRHKRKDGTLMDVEIIADLFDKKSNKVIVFIRDISERKKTERNIAKLARKITEKNKELDQIINVISYDLKEPLLNIQGFSRELYYDISEMAGVLLGNRSVDDIKEKVKILIEKNISDNLDHITSSTRIIERLVNGILNYSRLDKREIDKNKIDMNKLIKEIIKGFSLRLNKKRIKVEINKLPDCTGDKAYVGQVFSNLIDNAVKYINNTDSGCIRIYGEKKGENSVYTIEDNGPGISREDAKYIFNIFGRKEKTRKSVFGLGLPLSKKICNKLNGDVWFESEKAKGCRFYISLPAG
ncbi:MAG: PAS domain-containing sensor histidine kinase [Elusimicrobiota bacterium]